jgi:hypothetical protein
MAIVVDETHFTEFVHEMADARAGRTNHFRERFLAHLGDDLLRFTVVSEVRQ